MKINKITILLLFLLSLPQIGCKKQVCVTCKRVNIVTGKVTNTQTACAASKDEARREAFNRMPADSTGVIQCDN